VNVRNEQREYREAEAKLCDFIKGCGKGPSLTNRAKATIVDEELVKCSQRLFPELADDMSIMSYDKGTEPFGGR